MKFYFGVVSGMIIGSVSTNDRLRSCVRKISGFKMKIYAEQEILMSNDSLDFVKMM
jgi:hypothetical protein